jgi:hypothetical protein
MKRFGRIIVGIVLAIMLTACGTVVFADGVHITVTANPRVAGSVSNFTITYVDEKTIEFSWGFYGDASKIMIRGKVGGYPSGISSPDVAPSDGYLVYYGNGTSSSDVDWMMGSVARPVYYAAWAQRADGTWYTDQSRDWMENTFLIMAGLGIFLLLATCLTIAAVSKRSGLLSYGAVGAWMLTAFQAFYASASSSPGDITDAYMGLFWLSLAFVIACGVWPYASRDRKTVTEETGEDEWEAEDMSSFGNKKEEKFQPRKLRSKFGQTGVM